MIHKTTMKLLLAVLGLVTSLVAIEVEIRYTNPVLGLVLTKTDGADISAVGFNYVINGELYKARGVASSLGWMYRTSLPTNLGPDDHVYAYANIHDVNGNIRVTTQRSRLNLRTRSVAMEIPSRQIRGAVVFRDDFNDDSSISNNWRHEVSMYGGYNGEFQAYTNKKDNVFTKNGQLYIKPTLTIDDSRYDENSLWHGSMDMNSLFGTCTINAVSGCHREGRDGILPPIMSGRLNSVATLKYGTVTIRAKIPKGDWIWPAIWMMPKSSHYGTWPRSGEIDIMESRGNSGSYGTGKVSSTLHWGSDASHNRFQKTTGSQYDGDWHNNFHEWKLEWTPDHLSTSIDGKQIMWVDPGSNFWNFGGFGGNNIWGGAKMAPFDQDFYMILNVAVGGTGGFFNGNGQPWTNSHGQRQGQKDFWNARGSWQNTWHGDNTALIIDWVEFKSYY